MRTVCFVLRFSKIPGKEKVTYDFSTSGPLTKDDYTSATRVVIQND